MSLPINVKKMLLQMVQMSSAINHCFVHNQHMTTVIVLKCREMKMFLNVNCLLCIAKANCTEMVFPRQSGTLYILSIILYC